MKGRISDKLEAILKDDEGRRQLQRSLMSGKDGHIRVGRTKYKVSTKSELDHKSSTSGRSITRASFARRPAR